MLTTTETRTEIAMLVEPDINPDPTRYQVRPQPTFTSETCEFLGISESWWEPREAEKANPRRPLSLPHDLLGYRPLQLWFGMPHDADGEKDDDWLEELFSTLFELAEDLCASTFGVDRLALPSASPEHSPWADGNFSQAFIYYAGEIARQDPHDGGWDAVLIDPMQRAFLAQGVLAKALDEFVLSALLFGGTAEQQDALGQWDRIMLKEEGYMRKFKRCEEVQYYLSGGRVVTPFFWAEVARVTAETAQLLLPLINMQRRLSPDNDGQIQSLQVPSLPVFYQRLHDVVAIAGYASLCMAWSTSIFQVEFPQPGMLWEVDQERVADEFVYAMSEPNAMATEAANGTGWVPMYMDKRLAYIHEAKVKIVFWPRIARLKPQWNLRHTGVRSAAQTILTKSHNAFYYGGRTGGGGAGGDGDQNNGGGEAGGDNTAVSENGSRDSHEEISGIKEDDDEWPFLFEYVEHVGASKRRSQTIRLTRRLAAAWIVVSIMAWAVGMRFLEELSKAAGFDLAGISGVAGVRKACDSILGWLIAVAARISQVPSQAVAFVQAR
ncbi:hypothetical protein Sste5346_002469 [Sporothrix stenoceras]|uniref:Uncharacterized protein n=1 Tax=Sporothrix stenoceras TaxID=5173 RepID=A0ABR3ZID3_9PEZI